MENTKIERIKKSAGVTAKVLNVIKTILIVGIVLAFIGGLSVFFRLGDDGKTVEVFGKQIVVHNMVNLGDLSVKSFDFIDMFDIEEPVLKAGVNCFFAAFMIVMVLVCVIMIRKTFTTIEKSDTPFKPEILRSIKITGILVTVIVLSASIGIAAVVGLTLWCIYTIFDYGVELQKDADETLYGGDYGKDNTSSGPRDGGPQNEPERALGEGWRIKCQSLEDKDRQNQRSQILDACSNLPRAELPARRHPRIRSGRTG